MRERVFSTRQVACMLGVNTSRLQRAVWAGRVQAPAKGPGGAFLWTLSDLQRASWALLHRAYDPGREGDDDGRA